MGAPGMSGLGFAGTASCRERGWSRVWRPEPAPTFAGPGWAGAFVRRLWPGGASSRLRWVVTLLAVLGWVPPAQSANFAPVIPGRPLVFPADTGAHPDFRTEWWYVTGWLKDEAGRERGFQVTFFRVATGRGADNPSRFAPRQLVLAHAALADPARGRLLHAERAARADGRLAGAEEGATRAWLRDRGIGRWRIEGDGQRYTTRVEDDEFGFELELAATQAPMENGQAGFSQKAADPAHASYYYSQPQLAVRGRLRVGGEAAKSVAVEGRAWLDHEWSSAYLPEGALGWDWIGMNLADGGALMAFRMRDREGRAVWAGGSLRDAAGRHTVLASADLVFTPGRTWTSPRSGASYPVEWTVDVGQSATRRRFELRPLMDDQELDSRASTGAIYWEGAARLMENGREAGRGYLEMTGYAAGLEM
jgi:predicted secreted hydrolase